MTKSLPARVLLLSVTVLVLSGCVRGRATLPPLAPASQPNIQATVAKLETQVPVLMERAGIPGLSIALVRGGELVWHGSFGVTSTETNEPVSETTLFEAASLSKPLAAYAFLRLVERGQVALDEPLVTYVSEEDLRRDFLGAGFSDPRLGKITARMVLSHCSGFPNWREDETLTILFEPGARFSYSGEGFGLLQKVMEQVSGLSFEELMRAEVFVPLGMSSTTFVWTDEVAKRSASRHGMMRESAGPPQIRSAHAASAAMTTALDYGRFLAALLSGPYLSGRLREEMFRLQRPFGRATAIPAGWGLGIGVEGIASGHTAWHLGDAAGARCFFAAFPERETAVVYFTNSFYGLSIIHEVVDLVVGDETPFQLFGMGPFYPRLDSPQVVFPRTLRREGIDAAVAYFRQTLASAREDEEDPFPEPMLTTIAYSLLQRAGEVDAAISVLELNVEAHPDSFAAHDSLGEVLVIKGETARAIDSYRRSLELNPDNDNARAILARLRSEER